jgi:uncharacterized protein (TIGR02757 family)
VGQLIKNKKFNLIGDHLNYCFTTYHQSRYINLDPLFYLDRKQNKNDLEILSFILAGLSYGRVEQILKSYSSLLQKFKKLGTSANGDGLSQLILSINDDFLWKNALQGWVHRLNTSEDILKLIKILKIILVQDGSLCRHFQSCYDDNPKIHLHNFGKIFRELSTNTQHTKKWNGTGASWFVPTPFDGSTCKRLMMWLRWMIRNDEIDLGLWQSKGFFDENKIKPSTSRLFFPVDTHIFKWAQSHKITTRKSATWNSVEEITNFIQKICPEDPVRYDFSLCTAGKINFRKSLKE